MAGREAQHHTFEHDGRHSHALRESQLSFWRNSLSNFLIPQRRKDAVRPRTAVARHQFRVALSITGMF